MRARLRNDRTRELFSFERGGIARQEESSGTWRRRRRRRRGALRPRRPAKGRGNILLQTDVVHAAECQFHAYLHIQGILNFRCYMCGSYGMHNNVLLHFRTVLGEFISSRSVPDFRVTDEFFIQTDASSLQASICSTRMIQVGYSTYLTSASNEVLVCDGIVFLADFFLKPQI